MELSDTTAQQPVFVAPDMGIKGGLLTFELTVTDSGGMMATDTCQVRRNPIPKGQQEVRFLPFWRDHPLIPWSVRRDSDPQHPVPPLPPPLYTAREMIARLRVIGHAMQEKRNTVSSPIMSVDEQTLKVDGHGQ